jgi:hypothetical protein
MALGESYLRERDFVRNGRVMNHGVETWDLVKTKAGWKIVLVLYSIHPGPRD